MGQVVIKEISQIKSLLASKKILLVRTKSYEHLEIKKIFDEIPHVEFSEFTSNPSYEQVCAGIETYNKNRCEMIVAVGGGSTIDVAKCIKLYSKMDCNVSYLEQEMTDTGIHLVAVPTTAGTGSESTHYAVIYYKGIKQSISHESIIPDYAVLDPSVLKTLPVYQKKCTMLDALCQAIESWWSVNSNNESKIYSKKAIVGILNNWKSYIQDNTDEAASIIMEAANYAGKAIDITATTAAHAMSYKISSLYKVPHGHAVAVCMPEVWRYIFTHTDRCIDSRGSEYLKCTLEEINELINYNCYCNMIKELSISNPLARDREFELESLVRSVNSVRLKNYPVVLNAEELRKMYERIIK